jgi:hypothetical protein
MAPPRGAPCRLLVLLGLSMPDLQPEGRAGRGGRTPPRDRWALPFAPGLLGICAQTRPNQPLVPVPRVSHAGTVCGRPLACSLRTWSPNGLSQRARRTFRRSSFLLRLGLGLRRLIVRQPVERLPVSRPSASVGVGFFFTKTRAHFIGCWRGERESREQKGERGKVRY